MSAGTLYDTGVPSFEVRIYRNDRLLVREFCHSDEEAARVVAQGSDLDRVYLLVDDGSPSDGPGDVFAPEETRARDEMDQPLASMSLPGRGTE